MTPYQVFFLALVLVALLGTAYAAVCLAWCSIRCLRVANYGQSGVVLLALAGLLAVLLLVLGVWFAYGMSHQQKTLRRDLLTIALTFLPLGAAAYGAVRLSRGITDRLHPAPPPSN